MPRPTVDREERLELPRPPEPWRAPGFPLIAGIAPVIGSLLVWALTRSPFTLAFAALGPLVAAAGFVDGVVQSRRVRRRELARFRRQVDRCLAAIDERQSAERSLLRRATPDALAVLTSPSDDPERWRTEPSSAIPIVLGTGSVASSVWLSGETTGADDETAASLTALSRRASVLTAAPIVVDASLGIGLHGPVGLTMPVMRGLLVQLANLLPPSRASLIAPLGTEWEWLRQLPHRTSPGDASLYRWRFGGDELVVALAATERELPADCRVVLRVDGRSAVVSRAADTDIPDEVEVQFLSAEEAIGVARSLRAAAGRRGLLPEEAGSPPVFAELSDPVEGEAGLRCRFVRSAAGSLGLDLVADGPHAVIGGTTGSGKSELLVSWVLAMAAAHPPETVNFLLVDFKGGSSFAALRRLPHTVGLITDLDERSAHRALLSLTAELRFRERRLAEEGVRSIEEATAALPRLVIVVDEFAALVAGFPELHDLFADLAARGRSLGLHLVLCTQRPAGVIRDGVLANCALRISLRVNNRADSLAVIGTGDAADLPGDRAGDALVSLSGAAPVAVRVARATAEDIDGVAGRWTVPAGGLRRPWCEELPLLVALDGLPPAPAGLPIGLLDVPERQTRETAAYRPAVDGNLLVIGGQSSGKTTLLAALAVGAADRIPTDVEGAWDTIAAEAERVRRGSAPARLLLLDDVDGLLGRFAVDYRGPFVELLSEVMRDGGSSGLHVVLTVRRLTSLVQPLASLCDSRLLLRLSSRQDHLVAGGTAALYDDGLAPGSGEWQGHRVQLAVPPDVAEAPRAAPSPPLEWRGRRLLLVVSSRPAAFSRILGERCPPGWGMLQLSAGDRHEPSIVVGEADRATAILGSPDAWQGHWALLGAMRQEGAILFDRCALADFRAIAGSRELPPPVSGHRGDHWLLEPDGTIRRVAAVTATPGG
ncbi:MAG TPA: FtsK/SpoIIIE domain-containing protein [Lacisediminihabitans sp.]|uniref:FtsK/SpoIIIE domain-containing protein n=1 Tax=Lacisediminihabitans sp. TaxID=2787631 RepID=UPI002EDA5F4B